MAQPPLEPTVAFNVASTARTILPVPVLMQPDDESCGPTCVAKVARYFGLEGIDVEALIAAVPRAPSGGTFGPHLASLAMSLGMPVRLRPLAIQVFDPTWWVLQPAELRERLGARHGSLLEGPLKQAHAAWLGALDQGAELRLGEPDPAHLISAIDAGHPVICGLSCTWLYQQSRERQSDNAPDDILGSPTGHFVVVVGYEGRGERFAISDPYPGSPLSRGGRCWVPWSRLLPSILLGDVTNDAVLIEVMKPT